MCLRPSEPPGSPLSRSLFSSCCCTLGLIFSFIGDFIIIVSDGVYDNFDPEHLGVEPDLLPSYSKFFPGEDDKKKWLDIPLDIEHKLKQEFLVEALNTQYVPPQAFSPVRSGEPRVEVSELGEELPLKPANLGFSVFLLFLVCVLTVA